MISIFLGVPPRRGKVEKSPRSYAAGRDKPPGTRSRNIIELVAAVCGSAIINVPFVLTYSVPPRYHFANRLPSMGKGQGEGEGRDYRRQRCAERDNGPQ